MRNHNDIVTSTMKVVAVHKKNGIRVANVYEDKWMQKKKKSLEFLNVHVKAMLLIAFGIKILSFIINHFCLMRNVNIQKNIMIFYDFYVDMFDVFEFDFNIYNKLYAWK